MRLPSYHYSVIHSGGYWYFIALSMFQHFCKLRSRGVTVIYLEIMYVKVCASYQLSFFANTCCLTRELCSVMYYMYIYVMYICIFYAETHSFVNIGYFYIYIYYLYYKF